MAPEFVARTIIQPTLVYFSAHEFPAGVLDRVDPRLLAALDALRDKFGRPIHPSPVPGAWARTDGSAGSRHYAVGRLSDAGDIFPTGDVRQAWLAACSLPQIGGIGLYVDTQFRGEPWPMLHIDLRPNRLLWARTEGRYVYPLRSDAERDEFLQILAGAGRA